MANSILIIEDTSADRFILKRDLKKAGFQESIFEKIDGVQALEFLSDYDKNKAEFGDAFPPDIIFLDINMPRMNGFQFLEAFSAVNQKKPSYHSELIMMISSSEMREDIDKSLAHECVQGYLIKGEYTLDQLQAVIRNNE